MRKAKQKWRTKSGKKSSVTGERYLPSAAIKALSPAEYAATTEAKRRDKTGKTMRCIGLSLSTSQTASLAASTCFDNPAFYKVAFPFLTKMLQNTSVSFLVSCRFILD